MFVEVDGKRKWFPAALTECQQELISNQLSKEKYEHVPFNPRAAKNTFQKLTWPIQLLIGAMLAIPFAIMAGAAFVDEWIHAAYHWPLILGVCLLVVAEFPVIQKFRRTTKLQDAYSWKSVMAMKNDPRLIDPAEDGLFKELFTACGNNAALMDRHADTVNALLADQNIQRTYALLNDPDTPEDSKETLGKSFSGHIRTTVELIRELDEPRALDRRREVDELVQQLNADNTVRRQVTAQLRASDD